jgi:hypothetical protein
MAQMAILIYGDAIGRMPSQRLLMNCVPFFVVNLWFLFAQKSSSQLGIVGKLVSRYTCIVIMAND